jgi:hypothetical protein
LGPSFLVLQGLDQAGTLVNGFAVTYVNPTMPNGQVNLEMLDGSRASATAYLSGGWVGDLSPSQALFLVEAYEDLQDTGDLGGEGSTSSTQGLGTQSLGIQSLSPNSNLGTLNVTSPQTDCQKAWNGSWKTASSGALNCLQGAAGAACLVPHPIIKPVGCTVLGMVGVAQNFGLPSGSNCAEGAQAFGNLVNNCSLTQYTPDDGAANGYCVPVMGGPPACTPGTSCGCTANNSSHAAASP